jgi:hypothetical protein
MRTGPSALHRMGPQNQREGHRRDVAAVLVLDLDGPLRPVPESPFLLGEIENRHDRTLERLSRVRAGLPTRVEHMEMSVPEIEVILGHCDATA